LLLQLILYIWSRFAEEMNKRSLKKNKWIKSRGLVVAIWRSGHKANFASGKYQWVQQTTKTTFHAFVIMYKKTNRRPRGNQKFRNWIALTGILSKHTCSPYCEYICRRSLCNANEWTPNLKVLTVRRSISH
jgi:hypothetical protein